MRTETIIRTLYKFNELAEKAKSKALEKLYDLNVGHDWWGSTYEDAERIGAKITEFDISRSNSIKMSFSLNPEKVAKLIFKEHGKTCETFKLAKQFELDRNTEEFERALGEEYLHMLRREYEYLTSEKAIVETIEANEREFTEDGSLV